MFKISNVGESESIFFGSGTAKGHLSNSDPDPQGQFV